MRKIKLPLILSILAIVISSCHKLEQLPAVPHIEFKSFSIFDTTDILGTLSKGGRLKVTFEDGDGDLGLAAPTEGDTDTTNLFLTLFRRVNGKIVQASDNDLLKPSSYRIPYMERTGQNKILKGTISITFEYFFYSNADTVKYDFYIRDRALNDSNVESTPDIVISQNKIYIK
jgi:hypothetical protein